MKIGLDLDGCLYNFEDSLREFLRSEDYPEGLMTEPQRWSFHDDWGLSYEEFRDACNEGVDEGYVFSCGEPYEGVQEGVRRIKEMGHSIHIITARAYGSPGMAQLNTARWLAAYGIEYDTLTFSHDKTVVQTDVMLEDNIGNYEALEAAGTIAVLMDRPWNRGTPEDYRRTRVLSMDHFVELIEEMHD
ncbi:hypothetical protein [Rhodococcus sp. ACS1]|uniref:5' nucleotidase, NT5C type n=1 Tax=Rhodococcus sp. ACS1 TaxID=2028570 RepID=UPI0015C70E5B|nr:hypothetical protein [Rhodococcus sp. ACS1]